MPIQNFDSNPTFLSQVSNELYKGWVSIVNSYWTLLIRWVPPLPRYLKPHLGT